MISGGRLPDRGAARLLLAAGFVDATFVFLLLELTDAALDALLREFASEFMREIDGMAPDIQSVLTVATRSAMFLGLLILYWAVCDILLNGRSLGRLVLGLEPRASDGGRADRLRTSLRGVRKLTSLGLAGLSWNRRAPYDAGARIRWHSPLAPEAGRATRNWKLEIGSGRHKGQSRQLARIARFEAEGVIRIGRDPHWSDISLDEEERVSKRHAVLRIGRAGWEILDHRSHNRVRVSGRVIPQQVWHPLPPGKVFHVAEVAMKLTPR